MTTAVSFLLALVMPCLEAWVRRKADPFMRSSLRDLVTTCATHFVLICEDEFVAAAIEDDEHRVGTEVMLVLGMPGMFTWVATPLLDMILHALKTKEIVVKHGTLIVYSRFTAG
jgi:hypothetical protein